MVTAGHPRKHPTPEPPREVVVHELPGNPWDAWDDRRHTPEELTLPTSAESYFLRWEQLLGER